MRQFYLNMNIGGTLWHHTVIGDFIIMKIILLDDLYTFFLYLLSNWGYIENCEILKKFQNWWKFQVHANFFIISGLGMLYR